MDDPRAEELDSLSSLEERIQKTAELVTRLRRERDEAVKQGEAAVAEAAEAREQTGSLRREIEALRGERVQVRKRIEKLLGQMDLLNST